MTTLNLILALLPCLLLLWWFHARDKRPEPHHVIWVTFFLGIGTVIPVVLTAVPVLWLVGEIESDYLSGIWQAFMIAAIPEEFFKFLVLLLYCTRHRAFDEPMDGLVYGAVASLGFATFENVLYVFEGGIVAALMRAVTAVPGHACLGAIMGYYVGQARFHRVGKRYNYFMALLVPIVLHGLYDFPLLSLASMTDPATGELPADVSETTILLLMAGALAVFVVEVVWTLILVRRLRHEQDHIPRVEPADKWPDESR
jgi:RsiW-degrading membrane proteinase PrsW (M82 family)